MGMTMETDNKLYPLAVVVPVLSFLSIAIAIPPLALHAKNRNYPAAIVNCWAILLNILNIVNSLLWPTDDISSWWNGVGLCDVEVKLMVAGYVAIPGALVCIFRSLANVLDTRRAVLVPSKTQRWRNRLMELLFCVFVPIIAMSTHYIYQKNRYYIYSISGCVNNYDESWASFVFAWMWPLVICLIATYYCCLVMFRLYRYRSDFDAILRSSNSHTNRSRFMRLFLLAFTMLVAILPIECYIIYEDLRLSLPWHSYSWNRVHHENWGRIIMVPNRGGVFFDRWLPIGMGFIIFIFCGFGQDAVRLYRMMFWRLGFGHCFPNVARPLDSESSSQPGSNSTTLVNRSQRQKKWHSKWRKNGTDLESGMQRTSYHGRGTATKVVPWYRAPWSLFGRRPAVQRDQDNLLDNLTVPGHTVCTNAWAGTSQTRSSCDYSEGMASPLSKEAIRVKHVISQRSELSL